MAPKRQPKIAPAQKAAKAVRRVLATAVFQNGRRTWTRSACFLRVFMRTRLALELAGCIAELKVIKENRRGINQKLDVWRRLESIPAKQLQRQERLIASETNLFGYTSDR